MACCAPASAVCVWTLHPFGPVKASVVFDAAGDLTEAMLKRHEQVIDGMHLGTATPTDRTVRSTRTATCAGGLLRRWASRWQLDQLVPEPQRARAHHLRERPANGTQQVYYANGQQWLEYNIPQQGLRQGARTGPGTPMALKTTGTMHERYGISGSGTMPSRIRPSLCKTPRTTTHSPPGGVWKDSVIDFQ